MGPERGYQNLLYEVVDSCKTQVKTTEIKVESKKGLVICFVLFGEGR